MKYPRISIKEQTHCLFILLVLSSAYLYLNQDQTPNPQDQGSNPQNQARDYMILPHQENHFSANSNYNDNQQSDIAKVFGHAALTIIKEKQIQALNNPLRVVELGSGGGALSREIAPTIIENGGDYWQTDRIPQEDTFITKGAEQAIVDMTDCTSWKDKKNNDMKTPQTDIAVAGFSWHWTPDLFRSAESIAQQAPKFIGYVPFEKEDLYDIRRNAFKQFPQLLKHFPNKQRTQLNEYEKPLNQAWKHMSSLTSDLTTTMPEEKFKAFMNVWPEMSYLNQEQKTAYLAEIINNLPDCNKNKNHDTCLSNNYNPLTKRDIQFTEKILFFFATQLDADTASIIENLPSTLKEKASEVYGNQLVDMRFNTK